ncbi:MAG: class I SAM-dependent RNA methyltransferase [Aquificota bacterium]|nr:class I SAM-dependent RNA methyltransferase [Aquificota bacterium]
MRGSPSSETRKEAGERTIRLSIEKLVYGGYGLSRSENRVYLVRYAAPKELVDAEILEERKSFSEATVKRVVIPSPVRRDPFCPHFGECGGCQIQHIDYPAQVFLKEEILTETLRRIGKIKDVKLLDPIPSGQETGYRVRVQLKVKGGKVGFFRWRSREVVEIDSCPLVHPRINGILPGLREVARHIPEIQEIHVFYSPTEDEFLVKLITPTEVDRNLISRLKEDLLPAEVVGVGNYSRLRLFLNRRYFIGRDHTYVKVGKWTFRVSADSFFQVNHTLWERFIEAVVGDVSFRKALDLHCGVGFFTLPLSERGNFVEGSDSNPSAVDDAQYSARINGRDNTVFVKSDAYRFLKGRAGEMVDLVVLDPPRGGLEGGEGEVLVKSRPGRIIYVSCNPSTLARDLKFILKHGYRLEGVRVVDMFPQTYHVESVSYLTLQE